MRKIVIPTARMHALGMCGAHPVSGLNVMCHITHLLPGALQVIPGEYTRGGGSKVLVKRESTPSACYML